jgi:hypothetical protein
VFRTRPGTTDGEAEAMCMMCEEEFMFQAYLNYLGRKAAVEGEEAITADERALLKATGYTASGFACEPVPEADAAPGASPFSSMKGS